MKVYDLRQIILFILFFGRMSWRFQVHQTIESFCFVYHTVEKAKGRHEEVRLERMKSKYACIKAII